MLNLIRRIIRPVWRALKGERLGRELVAKTYLSGAGLEIGALHNPLNVPKNVEVKYVDRMTETDLRTHYPELAALPLVHVDVVDNGESLATVADGSQSFVIANHFLEHSQDPIATLKNMVRVLRPGGIVYLALPDKRYTFDVERPVTPLEHLKMDHANGPSATKDQHFSEWVSHVNGLTGDAFEREKKKLIEMDYSIHYHTWTLASFFEFLLGVHEDVGFEIELCMQNDQEILSVLRKRSDERERYRQRCADDRLSRARGSQS